MKGDKEGSNSYFLLASADDYSQVRILRYPCLKKSSKGVIGIAHSSHVTNVKWNGDDSFLYSSGGED